MNRLLYAIFFMADLLSAPLQNMEDSTGLNATRAINITYIGGGRLNRP